MKLTSFGNVVILIAFSHFDIVVGKVANVELERFRFYFLVLILNLFDLIHGVFWSYSICFLYF